MVNYYNRAHEQNKLRWLRYLWEVSLVKTLAAKHKTKVSTVMRRYMKYTAERRKVISVSIARKGKRPVVATFGKKPIQREEASIRDETQGFYVAHNQPIMRMLRTNCELCGKAEVMLVGHHVKKLKNLNKKWNGRKEKPAWVKRMIAIRRKTLFICPEYHKEIHNGKYDGGKLTKAYWTAGCSKSCTSGSAEGSWKSAA